MPDSSLFVIFIAGLLGGGHCIGMCGGIVAALTLNLPTGGRRWAYVLAYNIGRLASYVLIGAVLGAVAGAASYSLRPLQIGLYLLANLLIVAMGLYLAGLSGAIVLMERLGMPVWKRMQPLVRQLLPVRSAAQALLAGGVWGWVPCGLVYSASLSAMASGSLARGALVMLCFGLGTLPNLLALGAFAETLRRRLQDRKIRLAAGLLVVAMGAMQLARIGLSYLSA